MHTKFERLSPDFFRLIGEAMHEGFFIEATCLVLQFFEYSCFLVFALEFSKKTKGMKGKFKDELSVAERYPSFLAFILFTNNQMDYNLYQSYMALKKTRNRLVHNLVKRTNLEYDKSKIRKLLVNFLKHFTVFINRIEIPKNIL